MVFRQESCSLKVNTRSVITMISPINMFVSERINATLTRLHMSKWKVFWSCFNQQIPVPAERENVCRCTKKLKMRI